MRKIFRIAKREYKVSVQTKGFIIGLVLAPIFMGGGAIVMMLMKDRVDTTAKKVAIVDRSSLMAEALVEAADNRNAKEVYDEKTGKKVKPAYLFEIIAPNTENPASQRLELSNRVRNGQLHAFVEIGAGILHPGEEPQTSRIAYYSKNAVLDDLRQWMSWPINNHLRRLRLADAGIDEAAVKDLFNWLPVEGLGLVTVDTETGGIKDARRSNEGEAVGVPVVMMMLMFLMIMMSAVPLLNAVMQEKSQRIAEVLLGAVTPFQFMMGKVLGGVGVSLTGASVYVIGGIIAARRMGLTEYIPYHILPWFFAYMLMGIVMFGAILTALGSACNDAKDAQSLSMPAMLPVMIPMFLIMPVLREPQGTFATWLSLFPPFTPTLMLLRQSAPAGVPLWQAWGSLIGLLVFTVLFVWAGGRIFRVGILMQGKPPKLPDILRWAIRG
ncbi:ABC transporter permease [Candidatus Poribacteria bacterium]|nr:ABC transporter permease [Candidatus Poribacteria bacterium]